ncbi:Cytosolic 5'-nucleotidase 1A, partial [Anabarilius grahami]
TSFTIAVSSCALFSQETGDKGVAFPFVKALIMVNQRLTELVQAIDEQFVIVVIPTDSQDIVLLNNNITKHKLNVDRVCEITGEKTLLYHLNEIKPVLYLSTNPENVRDGINAGYGAATMIFPQKDYHEPSDEKLHVAFDGDGVLFSDESERVFIEQKLDGFLANERKNEDNPLEQGLLCKFLEALVHFQQRFKKSKNASNAKCPIHTYLVTTRGTESDGIRALKTLKKRNLEINEAFLLNGANKGPVLKAIKPHIFFDDQMRHIKGALENGVIGAHVPYGVRNE